MAARSPRQRTGELDDFDQQITELMEDVERYRTASEDALQQLDWCIGYFTGCNKRGVAKALSANRVSIRRNLMNRAPLPSPETTGEQS